MNRSDLASYLQQKGVPEDFYSLEGGNPSEAMVLDYSRSNLWYVYYSERGNGVLERVFAREEDACDYFLEPLRRGYGFVLPDL
ncbi:hypothetical protein M2152_001749 [Microbacteriaceae bacterium SG_E_30_P1]|uniref:Uncharacterized protein n=1 Tax=Antiquaquibacter oligotrophicus TaxID=2880260 RepID=A0ABT6KNI9_9MICO|nr:hypothetical protein [Antiquaquibacter oligotrophicus]